MSQFQLNFFHKLTLWALLTEPTPPHTLPLYLGVWTILVESKVSFDDIKIMSGFEIGLRKEIKKNLDSFLLDGSYFHYCKAIWKTIKKLNLYKKDLRYITIIISFIVKSYPFVKDEKWETYFKKIKPFSSSLGGNYLKLTDYFSKYWKVCELFNFTNN